MINIHEYRKYMATHTHGEGDQITMLQVMERCYGNRINESINYRAEIHHLCATKADKHNEVILVVDSYDCDWTHGHYIHVMPADPREVLQYIADVMNNREGPTTIRIDTPKEN